MSFIQTYLYPKLPVFLQNVAISAYGYTWQQRRFGGIFDQEWRNLKQRESFTTAQWSDYQTIQLRKLLVHAFETVPYYQETYRALGFTSEDFRRFELADLSSLPYLEKDTLRQYGATKLLSGKPEPGGAFFSSSGSTGTPTQVRYSLPFHQRINAVMEARVRNWAGLTRDDARGMIGGRRVLPDAANHPPFYRYNYFEKQTYFSSYHISRQNAPDYREGMIRNRVQYMTGYAMSNFFLASFLNELQLEVPPLKAVITSSEKLTPEMRAVFKQVYGCKTFDSYSGVENCGFISETEYGQLLISPDVGILEVVKEDGTPAAPGERGEVISTGLLNWDQPLIRYRIGDVIQLSADQHTKCGREMPVVEEIVGRVEDTVIGADGRMMVRFHGIFIDLPNVVKGQVVQQDYTDFDVNVETKNGLQPEEMATIIKRIKSQLGECTIRIHELDQIPPGPNGKFKAVISNVGRKKSGISRF